MFRNSSNPAQAYVKIGVETGVLSANPHKLIVMLFEGAMLAITTAGLHMQRREIAEKGRAISQAIDIINCGLKASLDKSSGGDLAEKLDALYDYMSTRLLFANLNNSQAALDEVRSLLGEIKSAWEEIANHPAALSANKAAA